MTTSTIVLIRSDGPNWDGLRAELDRLPDVRVVGDCSRAREALKQIPALRPGLVVCGRTVEGASVVSLLAEMRPRVPDAVFVVISGRVPTDEIVRLAALQPLNLVDWEDLSGPTFAAAHEAIRGRSFIVWNRELFASVIAALVEPRTPSLPPNVKVSKREREVLPHVAAGETEKEIGRALGISPATVRTHIENMAGKLKARNRHHLVHLGWQYGLLGNDLTGKDTTK